MRDLVERILRSTGCRLPVAGRFVVLVRTPVAARRVAAARSDPHITRAHWAADSRKFRTRMRDLREPLRVGSVSAQAAEFLNAVVCAGLNILVSGATQSGNTTMLRALLASARPEERIVTSRRRSNSRSPHRTGLPCSAGRRRSKARARSRYGGW